MPTALITWDEWHLTDAATMDSCAEGLFAGTPSIRSAVQRMRDGAGNELRRLDLFLPDDTKREVDLGQWVVVLGGALQVMSDEQHGALNPQGQ